MKRFVNGEAAELDESGFTVERLSDRLMVRTPEGSFSAIAVRQGQAVLVSFKGLQYRIEERQSRVSAATSSGTGELRAPMPGQIVDVRSAVGGTVRKGETLMVLEAMKTQQPLLAPFDGTVVQIGVDKGDQVSEGTLLVTVEALEGQHG